MNRNKAYIGALIIIFLAVITWSSYQMLNIGKEELFYSVSVIVNNSNSDRWTAMREGLEQAAGDYHIKLNVVSTVEIKNLQEEQALIKREIDNGAEGIIIQLVNSYGASSYLEHVSSDVVIMLLETDVIPEDIYASAMPNNKIMGRAIGQSMLEDLGWDLDGKSIGVLCGNQLKLSMQQRLTGFHESMAGREHLIQWVLESNEEELRAKLKNNLEKYPIDVIVALGDDEMETAIDYLVEECKEDSDKYLLYGEGCSEKLVYYLDKGMIRTLTVPNEFNMGYQSVEAVAKQLKNKFSYEDKIKINYLTINKENLYDEDNQKILFPIVQ